MAGSPRRCRQVYTQWRDGSTRGLSRWLFIGQLTASLAFIIYSWMLGNWVFVVTNVLMLVTAAFGQWVYSRTGATRTDAQPDIRNFSYDDRLLVFRTLRWLRRSILAKLSVD